MKYNDAYALLDMIKVQRKQAVSLEGLPKVKALIWANELCEVIEDMPSTVAGPAGIDVMHEKLIVAKALKDAADAYLKEIRGMYA